MLFACESDEIAFVPSTSAGLSMVAAGLDWKAGDSVVTAEGEFPSNIYPWRALQTRGVRLKLISARRGDGITLEDVCAAVDSRTRLVALSSVHYITGAVPDVAAIGNYLRRLGILFCVDAIQGAGAVRTAWEAADFLVADGHKWLLAPQGIGVLVVRARVLDTLSPVLVGWKSVDAQDYCLSGQFRLGAQRYEPGTLNVVGMIGLHASLGLLLEIGPNIIYDRIAVLRTYTQTRLAEAGCQICGYSGSGIVAFSVSQTTAQHVMASLAGLGILASVRRNLDGQPCVRVAPHFYNTERDIDRLAAAID